MSTPTDELKAAARAAGADLVGVADLAPFKRQRAALPPGLLEPYTRAAAVALRLEDTIIDGIQAAPTPDYARHYRAVNAALDRLTAELVNWVSARRFAARAIPASEFADEPNLLGSLSHKAVAHMAGLGWQGKSLLIVTPQYGPRVRLATVLTDMPLVPDLPLKSRCGRCLRCVRACPATAIKRVTLAERYERREAVLQVSRCAEKMSKFQARFDLAARVCGVCVSVCPFGKRRGRTESMVRRPFTIT
ncbi:MAG TPA: 4Fe-4S double cluster binding domain-containing protein [Dongiaceae bacterium]|nr:4Fe-4S double cluster binding domain-containing protein [Dongiaceae bacterium]